MQMSKLQTPSSQALWAEIRRCYADGNAQKLFFGSAGEMHAPHPFNLISSGVNIFARYVFGWSNGPKGLALERQRPFPAML